MKMQSPYIPVITHSRNFGNNFLVFSESCKEDQFKDFDANLNLLISKTQSSGHVKCKWVDCGKTFSYLDDLATHVSTFHSNSGPGGLFYCRWDGCSRGDRGFNARYKMLVHVRTHTNEKPHQCFQCNKSFSRAENLKIHARSHTGEKPYVCPVAGCGKAYSNSSDRFKHTRTHSVHKPYVCKVPSCGKRYTDPSSLRKHVKTYRHFPSNYPLDENSPRRSLEELKMDVENEGVRGGMMAADNEVTFSDSSDSSPLKNHFDCENTGSLTFTVLKSWLTSESVFKSFVNSTRYHSSMDNCDRCVYFKEQDFPLDLTVRK